jgi:hypothetical protein
MADLACASWTEFGNRTSEETDIPFRTYMLGGPYGTD